MNTLKDHLAKKLGSGHNGTYNGIESMTIFLMMMMEMIKRRIYRPMLVFILMMISMTMLTWQSEMEDWSKNLYFNTMVLCVK